MKADDVSQRARAPEAIPSSCRVQGCSRPTQRAAGRGLSYRLCKRHAERQRKTGSASHGNLKAHELAVFRSAVRRLHRQHKADADWRLALRGLDLLLRSSDGVRWDVGLKGLSSQDKAQVVFARARAMGTSATDLLEVALAVLAMIRHLGITRQDYIWCQLAKPLVRRHTPTAWRPRETSSRSAGKMLRIVGRSIWAVVKWAVTPDTLDAVIRLAEPKLKAAREAEARRRDKAKVRSATEAKLKRVILDARERGAGPSELVGIEARLRQQYGLGVRHGR